MAMSPEKPADGPEEVTARSDSSQADADHSDQLPIGERLAKLRGEHRYSIRKLAQKAGVSASLISDVERGKVEPSISTLKRMSAALGTNLTYFFSQPTQQTGRVVRASERVVLNGENESPGGVRSTIETSGIRFELASPEQAEGIEAIYGRYEVGASLGDESVTHEGEEWGMVLSGRLKVWVGEEIHFLDPGDAIWFPSTTPHRMENVADEETTYIWIDTPKSF